MISGVATKALILVVGLGAGLGAGEIGSMYNYDETIAAHNQGNKIFNKVQLTTISQEPGHGIKVGSDKQHIGGWEDKTRVGGNAKGGGQVGENDVDIIFTQNRLTKSDNDSNGGSQNNTSKTQKGLSNRHVCILLGKNLVGGLNNGVTTTSNSHSGEQQSQGKDVCWNFSKEVSKIKSDGSRYDISATGGNDSRVFIDSTKDHRLGVLELDPQTSKVKRALGRKGWVLGLKVDNPEKWCKASYQKESVTWSVNSLNSPLNKKNKENMGKIGFDFLSQYVMVWYEEGDKMTTGWGTNNNGHSNGSKKKYMEVINCYQV